LATRPGLGSLARPAVPIRGGLGCYICGHVNKRLDIASIPKDATGDHSAGELDDRELGGRELDDRELDDRELDDRELVGRAREGDADAFRRLYDRHKRRAYSLAYGMLKNQDDALDVVQEGFIKAHRHLDRFEGNSSFYTWLYRIIMNLAIDHIRKAKRTRHVDFNDALSHEQDDAPVGEESLLPQILGANPHTSLARREIRDHIASALETLSDKHRAVLILREVDGLSYEEMAQVMECSKGTIMSRLFHARKNMQKRLLELMHGDGDAGGARGDES